MDFSVIIVTAPENSFIFNCFKKDRRMKEMIFMAAMLTALPIWVWKTIFVPLELQHNDRVQNYNSVKVK